MTELLGGRVAIVTGAGGGLGRAHALALAAHGAKVVVNDMGSARDGSPLAVSLAMQVVEEIRASGGEAFGHTADVTDYTQVCDMVAQAEALWGSVDIVINNAGILRDKTFAKMELGDFRKVVDVHLMGAVHCTKAVWKGMRARRYGRIVFTTSSSGLYGNFGQSNYGAAKLALVGLMNTLRLEGEKYGIRVNCISPSAATRMTDDVLDPPRLRLLDPLLVAPGVVALAAQAAPNGIILCGGGGSFERAHITLTNGALLGQASPSQILERMEEIGNRTGEFIPTSGPRQAEWEVARASRKCDLGHKGDASQTT